MREYDLVVVGGGAGGMSAARTARRRGAAVLLVQQGEIGGDCTFTGCVPSKTLLESAAAGLGFDEAMARVRASVATIAATEDDGAFAREGIEVRHGFATFRSPHELDVDGVVVRARRFVVATGASPRRPDIGLEAVPHRTSDDIWELDRRPGSLVVIGGGPVGCELAHAFARLGTDVTIVHPRDRLLDVEDAEASAVVARAMARDGVTLRLGARAGAVERVGDGVRVHAGAGPPIDADVVLVASGRVATVDGLGLDAAGVEVGDHGVVVDATLRTTADHVYAVGDVVGGLRFTHAADEMGRIAVANALSRQRFRRFHPERIPRVTFTSPEVAGVGVGEAEAPPGARVAYLPMDEVDRAVTADATDGFVKLVAAPRKVLGSAAGGRVVGATIVAPRAGEMIHEVVLAMRTRMFTGRLAQTVHAYPTWSVAVQQAAAQFFFEVGGRAARPVRR